MKNRMQQSKPKADKQLPRGLRNCNPLNIRKNTDLWQGLRKEQTDPVFFQFVTMAYGYRAAFITLRTYFGKYGVHNLRGIITRWAPPVDGNETEMYIRMVTTLTGIASDKELDIENAACMTEIVAAMSRVENGKKAHPAEVAEGWRLYRG